MHPGPAGSTASREPALPNVDCNICFSSGELREQVGAEVLAKDERNIREKSHFTCPSPALLLCCFNQLVTILVGF